MGRALSRGTSVVTEVEAQAVLRAWPEAAGGQLTAITTGLINVTYRVDTDRGAFSLQRLAPIFGREVHEDIAAVTEHLAAKGLTTPRLLRTATGRWDADGADGVWRLMTWIEGDCRTRLSDAGAARQAGLLLGQFHRALADFDAPLRHRRLGVHDTPAHLQGLRDALVAHADHSDYDEIAPIGEAILRAAEATPDLPDLPERIVHGDPKVSNLLFDEDGQGRAVIDLDTVARMALPLELGDAFRSWCNPKGEDAAAARFDLELFQGAVEGYAAATGRELSEEEQGALVGGTATIMVELAARFCRDALEERYFGWDPTRHATRSAHNRVRAAGQLALAEDLADRRAEAEGAVVRAFARA